MTQEGRFKVTLADKKFNTEAYKRFKQGNPAYMWVGPQAKGNSKSKFNRDPSKQA